MPAPPAPTAQARGWPRPSPAAGRSAGHVTGRGGCTRAVPVPDLSVPVPDLSVPGLSLGGKSGPAAPGSALGRLRWVAVAESRGTRVPRGQPGGTGRSASAEKRDLGIWVRRAGGAPAGSRGVRPVLGASGPRLSPPLRQDDVCRSLPSSARDRVKS